MDAQEWAPAPLQPVLRLIHCIQKERGASCALVGSLGQSNSSDGSFGEQQYKSYLRSARTASNSAMSSFYKSPAWCNARARKDEEINLEIAAMLYGVRQLVDGGMDDENDILFFHDVVVAYNKFLSCVIQVFVITEVFNRKKDEQKKFSDPKTGNVSRRNAKVALSLLELILSFVTLKESLGVERATLSGLMANGLNKINDNNENSIDLKKSNNDARLNVVVNDLVMVVENQHQIMRHLRKQSGLTVFESVVNLREETCPEETELFLDGNYRALLRLVGDSIRPSDAMISLQDHIREDFDVEGFRQAMDQDQFWYAITLYMDRLHAMELLILEELENCEGCFDSLDLLSLKDEKLAPSLETQIPTELTQHQRQPSILLPMRSKDEKRPELEEWEINLYEVEFHKRIGRGSAGTTYLGRYCKQDVAVKVAATSEMGLYGFTAELMSLKKLHHANIIRFLGAIYNPSPLTYCLVLEYCDGGDLAVALAGGNTPPKFFTNVASGVANGMFYLHKMKYLHRDIKPSNVLLAGDPKSGKFVAKLTDFGLAVKIQNSSVKNGQDLTAETGTYRYMAPEVIRHECYDYAADVFSFGLLMWEVVTHEKPFEPMSQIEAAGSVAIEGKRPPFPETTPQALRDLIEKCWAEKPGERMEVEQIIKCLGDLSGNAATESWLAAPSGHPVYKEVPQNRQYSCVDTPADGQDVKPQPEKKKASMLKSSLFRKKRT